MRAHSVAIQVRWSDADPAGIAFYPRFFERYDVGTAAPFESAGLPWPEIFPKCDIVGVPIVESGSRFASPVHYGNALTVHSQVAWVRCGGRLPVIATVDPLAVQAILAHLARSAAPAPPGPAPRAPAALTWPAPEGLSRRCP